MKRRSRTAALLAAAAVCLAAQTLAAPIAGAQTSPEDSPEAEQVQARDRLIANQETLLNTYRCRFDIDTHIVPGGCTNNTPAQDPQPPTPFQGNPTETDIQTRDQLIANQETLLNTYRCQFDIDTHIVPGRCTNNTPPTEPTTSPTEPAPASQFTQITSLGGGICGLRADQTLACWNWETQQDDQGNRHRVLVEQDVPTGQFTHIANYDTGRNFVCGLRADQTLACWNWETQQDDQGNRHRVLVEQDVPTGQFTHIAQIADRDLIMCGLRADQTLTCWALTYLGPDWDVIWVELDTPAGQFTQIPQIADLGGVVCGLRADQTLTCWDWKHRRDIDGNDLGWILAQQDGPAGQFTHFAAQLGGAMCGLRADQTLACWDWELSRDHNWVFVERDTPTGQFTQIPEQFTQIPQTAEFNFAGCRIQADQTLTCWNWENAVAIQGREHNPVRVELDGPAGQFTQIAGFTEIGGFDGAMCGLRADQTIACWNWAVQWDDQEGTGHYTLVELDLPVQQ
ncbi:MAG: hypothetical protein OXG30_04140 [bacterium]|nr:hypothetical protein [bacterium]MCY4134088.1 hypothetical protein [bacterium]